MKKIWSIISVILVVLAVVFKVIIYSKEKQELANLRQSAEEGNADAQSNLGDLYFSGKRVSANKAEATKWYLKASEQGDAEGQLLLATMYYLGSGVSVDYVAAYMWCNLALTQGEEHAKIGIGEISAEMTEEQIAEAQNLSREWMAKHSERQ